MFPEAASFALYLFDYCKLDNLDAFMLVYILIVNLIVITLDNEFTFMWVSTDSEIPIIDNTQRAPMTEIKNGLRKRYLFLCTTWISRLLSAVNG